jgi:hypothetical protein
MLVKFNLIGSDFQYSDRHVIETMDTDLPLSKATYYQNIYSLLPLDLTFN